MTPEEIFVKAITAGMSFTDTGHIDCSRFSCRFCVFKTLVGCKYATCRDNLFKQGISLRDECLKLLPLYREQHPELFL